MQRRLSRGSVTLQVLGFASAFKQMSKRHQIGPLKDSTQEKSAFSFASSCSDAPSLESLSVRVQVRVTASINRRPSNVAIVAKAIMLGPLAEIIEVERTHDIRRNWRYPRPRQGIAQTSCPARI